MAEGDVLTNFFEGWSLAEIEGFIGNLPYEVGVIFLPGEGVIYAKEGSDHDIEFNDAEAELMEGRVFTHNHPGGDSFSDWDIEMAWTFDIAQLRVVTPVRIFLMDQPPQGWDHFTLEEIGLFASAHEEQVQEELDLGIISADSRMHEIWSRACAKLGIPYTAADVAEV